MQTLKKFTKAQVVMIGGILVGLPAVAWWCRSDAELPFKLLGGILVLMILTGAWQFYTMQRRRQLWPKMKLEGQKGWLEISPTTEQEFSANFDSAMVRPFLERIQPLIESGFGPHEIDDICDAVTKLPHDEKMELELPIRYSGRHALLKVGIFMDDIESPDLYMVAPPGLAKQIQSAYVQYTKELGI
jgi:hypothetical protein